MKRRTVSDILERWELDPEEVTARIITGDDGRPKLQIRVELGLLQMEMTGRPDGRRPHDCESLLDYYLGLLEAHRRRHGSIDGFVLSPQACEQLRAEATQYYQRYFGLFHLQEYAAVARDTARNLMVCDLLHSHAATEEDRWEMEQYRAYILMMNGLARAEAALLEYDYETAERVIEVAIAAIRTHASENLGRIQVGNEATILRQRLDEIRRAAPRSETDRLQRQLDDAIAREDYETAARLRDRLAELTDRRLPPIWE